MTTLDVSPDPPRDPPQDAAVESNGSVELLRNGAEAFPAWLEAIRQAREEVLLEMYWFQSDKTGWRFAEALIERARAGVEVFVIYDSIGCLGTDRRMFDAIAAAGGKVIEFHPVAPWRLRFRLDRVGLRDHRKILVVDGDVGFTGGINICDQSAPREEGGGGWRDDAVRVEGPAVRELRALFFDTWLRLNGPRPRMGPVSRRRREQMALAARAQVGGTIPPPPRTLRAMMFRKSHPQWSEVNPRTRARAPRIQVIGHEGWAARRTIRSMYVRHIRAAKEKILIANSYFLPDRAVRRVLERAARRGVEVRVIVPEKSDVPSVAHAARRLYGQLIEAGVHIHHWVDGMMHAKTAVIDGWATVGSYNLDYRSLRYNLEANVASEDVGFARAVEASIREDLTRCREVTLEEWKRRPLLQKIIEWFHFLVRGLL